MTFNYFSKNGEVLPLKDAVVPLSSIEYSYGYGVYETLRVSNGVVHFLSDHLDRLLESARIINLEHIFEASKIEKYLIELIKENKVETCNVKILLIGGSKKEEAQLFIICLNPLFPDKRLYRDGANLVTSQYERIYPHAKTMNMLQSYLAYRKAREVGAYDSLIINRAGFVTEGTRTNFFCIRGKTIYTPSEKDILLGVTRKMVLKVALDNGYRVEEANIGVGDIAEYDGAFISSTSSKIIPIKTVDDKVLKPIPEELKRLMSLFDEFLSEYEASEV